VLGRVHHDEHGQEETFLLIAEGDAAQGGFGRIDAVVGVDMHDVFIFGHRPERAVFALLAVMDRVFTAQTLEIRPHRICPEELRVADVDLFKRDRVGVRNRLVSTGSQGITHDGVSIVFPEA